LFPQPASASHAGRRRYVLTAAEVEELVAKLDAKLVT
jgi:hypothetical protein